MNQFYLVRKNPYSTKNISIDLQRGIGFKIKPKNLIFYEGIQVKKMTLWKHSCIITVLQKKIKKKLDFYLQYIVHLMDDDSDSNPDDARIALDDLARYRNLIMHRYYIFLDPKYIQILFNKISLLEQELQRKLYYTQMMDTKQTRRSR